MPSNAQNIALTVQNTLTARGTTIPPYLSNNLAAICQLFINLTAGTRSTVRAFLTAQDAQVRALLAAAVGLSVKGDIISQQISILRQGAETILGQVDHVMTTVGLDSVAKQSPDLSNLLKSVAEALPLTIPTTVVTSLAGIGGFDFFEGITDYKSLRNKLDDLLFDAARATALSNYANQANDYAKDILNRIEVYITIIDSLDIPLTSLSITPADGNLVFGSVKIGSTSIQTITIQNTSTGTVTFNWAPLNVPFSIIGLPVEQTSMTLYSPIAFTLNVQFAPTLAGLAAQIMNIGYTATTGPANPFAITIQGVGT